MMKNLISKILAFSGLALLMLSSCQKDGTLVTISSSSTTAGTLTASSTTPVLTKASLTATSVSFSGTTATYGYSAAVTNSLQFDVHGDNFATIKKEVVLSNSALSQSYNVQDFNNILLAMGLKAGTTVQVDVRLKSALSASAGIVYSNVVSLTVTPFALASWLYVPGAYEGWNNPGPAEDSLVSVTGNGIYSGIINFTAGNNQFLVTPAKNWNNKYATNDAASTTGTSSNYNVVYNGNNNFYAPTTPGNYLVTININNNTMTIQPADYYSIIGDAAQGWNTDVTMKYVNDGKGNWFSTPPTSPGSVGPTPMVSTGTFKIREDNDWTYSWGIPKAAGADGFGIANTLNDNNNNNIPIAVSGNYLVTFYAPATVHGAVPTAPASTTTTYTSVKQ
jgi:hypothetical protein